jgi:hypothetical protein
MFTAERAENAERNNLNRNCGLCRLACKKKTSAIFAISAVDLFYRSVRRERRGLIVKKSKEMRNEKSYFIQLVGRVVHGSRPGHGR